MNLTIWLPRCTLPSEQFWLIYLHAILRVRCALASHIWFCLIGFSTVLTYQHHIVDVVAGFILAAVCFYLFREAKPCLP